MVTTSRLNFKKMAAYIKVDEKEVECHAISVDEEKKHLSCWTESSAGKNFSFHLDHEDIPGSLQIVLWMDGSVVVKTAYLPATKKVSRVWKYLQTSATTGRYFAFSPLNLTDEDANLNVGSNVMDKVGTIELEVHEMVYREHKGARSSQLKTFQKPHALKIPEVMVKGQAMHQVGFGAEQEIERLAQKARVVTKKKTHHTSELKGLIAKFTFRYRPLDSLQRSGILPREPSPSLRRSEPIDVLSHSPSASLTQQISKKRKASHLKVKEEVKEEEAEVQDQLAADDDDAYERALLAELEKLRNKRSVKKESVAGDVPRKRVKREPRSFFTPGEVIDLT